MYTMEIIHSIRETFCSFTDYDSCSTRKEYWSYALFACIILLVVYALILISSPLSEYTQYIQQLDTAGHPVGEERHIVVANIGIIGKIVLILVFIFLLIPGIAVTVRRLHDSGHSGAWFFIQLIPTIGFFILIIFMCLPSKLDSDYRDPFEDYE